MKVCCLIDSLNSGGAQRQMTWLIRALVANGHQVHLMTYHSYDHYLPLVRESGVEPDCFDSTTKVGRFWKFRCEIRAVKPDVIISFLDVPNFIGLFAGMSPGRIPVIVSERNHDIGGKTRQTSFRFNGFRLASKVITNSHSQREFIHNNYSFLSSKLGTILNCVDLEKFSPAATLPSGQSRMLVAASVCQRKNTHGLIQACQHIKQRGIDVKIDWYGNDFFKDGVPTDESSYFLDCQSKIKMLNLEDVVQLHKPVQKIEKIFNGYHGCCLPSFREGCPNVICEALSSGIPSLVSNHGDMKRMIDASRGFVFDPNSPESIADAVVAFVSLTDEQRALMGRESRAFAEKHLGPERFASEYESLIQELAG